MSTKFDQNVNNEDLTTDAMPSSPRNTRRPSKEKQFSDSGTYKNENTDSTNFAHKKSRPRGFPKIRVPQQAFMVNVCNSTNVNVIGSKNFYGCSDVDEKKTSPRRKSEVIETEAIHLLFSNNSPITFHDIGIVSTHMGEGWRDSIRLLGYSDGQLDQYEEAHRPSIKETIYQLLRDWKEHKAEQATVAILSRTLWKTNQEDAVDRWSNER